MPVTPLAHTPALCESGVRARMAFGMVFEPIRLFVHEAILHASSLAGQLGAELATVVPQSKFVVMVSNGLATAVEWARCCLCPEGKFWCFSCGNVGPNSERRECPGGCPQCAACASFGVSHECLTVHEKAALRIFMGEMREIFTPLKKPGRDLVYLLLEQCLDSIESTGEVRTDENTSLYTDSIGAGQEGHIVLPCLVSDHMRSLRVFKDAMAAYCPNHWKDMYGREFGNSLAEDTLRVYRTTSGDGGVILRDGTARMVPVGALIRVTAWVMDQFVFYFPAWCPSFSIVGGQRAWSMYAWSLGNVRDGPRPLVNIFGRRPLAVSDLKRYRCSLPTAKWEEICSREAPAYQVEARSRLNRRICPSANSSGVRHLAIPAIAPDALERAEKMRQRILRQSQAVNPAIPNPFPQLQSNTPQLDEKGEAAAHPPASAAAERVAPSIQQQGQDTQRVEGVGMGQGATHRDAGGPPGFRSPYQTNPYGGQIASDFAGHSVAQQAYHGTVPPKESIEWSFTPQGVHAPPRQYGLSQEQWEGYYPPRGAPRTEFTQRRHESSAYLGRGHQAQHYAQQQHSQGLTAHEQPPRHRLSPRQDRAPPHAEPIRRPAYSPEQLTYPLRPQVRSGRQWPQPEGVYHYQGVYHSPGGYPAQGATSGGPTSQRGPPVNSDRQAPPRESHQQSGQVHPSPQDSDSKVQEASHMDTSRL